MSGAPPIRMRAPCVEEEALRTSHVFTRSRQAPSGDTPRRAGLGEHIDQSATPARDSVACNGSASSF
jgi:hypothetical protein